MRRAAGTLFVVAVTSVFFVDYCAFLFDCGCMSLWRGGAEACNIHEAMGPHCPWCSRPFLGGGVAFLGTMAAQLGILWLPGAPGLPARLLAALAAFPIVSGVVGSLQAVLFGYWGYWGPPA